METLEIQRVRGTNDVVPPERALQQVAEQRWRQIFALYGYEPIDTPVLEPTDLFLRKHGEAIAARMYSFTHWNRDLCLRPEFTASVIRSYVNHLQDRPLPVRLQYAGPTFRYEKPQRLRHRQLTEVGIECIGASGPVADAEVLALARHGLEALGVDGAHFVVGHLGAVLELLTQLGMEPRTQSLVLGVMEHLGRAPGEAAEVVDRLVAILGRNEPAPDSSDGSLADLLRSFGPAGAARIAGDLLEQANLSLGGGSRSPDEIVERLLQKSFRPDPRPGLERAVEFIGRLRSSAGRPADALPALRQVLSDFGLRDEPVREVEQALTYFDAYFDGPAAIEVDLSLARGLRYYTGLVFEVYDDQGNQLAGGGRYDDLVKALGGRSAVPACGFSYGLERVLAALKARRKVAASAPAVSVLVVAIAPEDYADAARLAAQLRREGIGVEVDLRFRGLKPNLRHADRGGIPLVLFIGERERTESVVGLRDMRAFEETRVPISEVTAAVRARMSKDVADGR